MMRLAKAGRLWCRTRLAAALMACSLLVTVSCANGIDEDPGNRRLAVLKRDAVRRIVYPGAKLLKVEESEAPHSADAFERRVGPSVVRSYWLPQRVHPIEIFDWYESKVGKAGWLVSPGVQPPRSRLFGKAVDDWCAFLEVEVARDAASFIVLLSASYNSSAGQC